MIAAWIIGGIFLMLWGILIGQGLDNKHWEDEGEPVKSWQQMEKEYLEARGL